MKSPTGTALFAYWEYTDCTVAENAFQMYGLWECINLLASINQFYGL